MTEDYLKILDDILKYFKEPGKNFLPGEIRSEYFKTINARLFISAIDKLLKDGYLIDNSKPELQIEMKHFAISFAGLVFIKNGGYQSQAKLAANQKFLLSAEKWLIVFGVVAAGVYGLYELILAICFLF